MPRVPPDIVDRIFDYVVEQIPELAERRRMVERAIRDEFGTMRGYVRRHTGEQQAFALTLSTEVGRLFNGRNASEVARVLQISRATVYRLLKQPGRR